MTEIIPASATKIAKIDDALGSVALVAIGVDAYDSASGFTKLNTCVNDAESVVKAYIEVKELLLKNDHYRLLTSKTTPAPSRGEILRAAKQLADWGDDVERIVFYFSGHGFRKGEKFYLVPQDAYDPDDVNGFVDFSDVVARLDASSARVKVIVLDACFSGPTIGGPKFIPAAYSAKFLADYIKTTRGFVLFSSSAENQQSFTKSPDPKQSLFTHFLIRALRGEPSALNDRYLTSSSLSEYVSTEVRRFAKSAQLTIQKPSVFVNSDGAIVIANFNTPLLPASVNPLEESPVQQLTLRTSESFRTDDVLTKIRRWTAYSEDYLERLVNNGLADHLHDDLARKASSLRQALNLSPSDVNVEGAAIAFPVRWTPSV
ncbi:hypothetical protein DB347_25445, partial [Opitutaceae bacterium EW11]